MMPDQLKLNELGGFGYDQYVADAAKQVESMAKECGGFDWPREATGGWDGNDASSSDSRVEADPSRSWSEGVFLTTLLDMVASCLDNDYDTNLQLTSVISRLAQVGCRFLILMCIVKSENDLYLGQRARVYNIFLSFRNKSKKLGLYFLT